MKNFSLLGILLLFATFAYADPCLPGSLQDYINLGVTGCTLDGGTFSNFSLAPGQSFATPIDPNLVQVTPDGGPSTPALLLTLNSSASAGELFELFFRFDLAGAFTAASILLGSPVITGDGADTGILDVCAGGSFAGDSPLGCSGTALNTVAFAIDGDALLSSSVDLPIASFFDIFADITIDGGLSGSATLDSASVSASASGAVPEPSALLLMSSVLIGLAIVKARPKRRC